MKVAELANGSHNIVLNYVPASLKENPSESIRAWRLISRHEVNSGLDFLLSDGVINALEVNVLEFKIGRVDVSRSQLAMAHASREMLSNNLLFELVFSDPSIISFQPVDVVFPASSIDSEVEEFCVGVSLFNVTNARTLLLPGFFNRHKANDAAFEAGADVPLLG